MLLTEIAILKNKTTEMEKECKTNRNTFFSSLLIYQKFSSNYSNAINIKVN